MAKFRTLSQKFLKGHPSEGIPTYFVEAFLKSIGVEYLAAEYYHKLCELNPEANKDDLRDFYLALSNMPHILYTKPHTIRAGKHFKDGDLISVRAWLGQPYNSKPIKLWDDLEVVKTYPYYIANGVHFLNDKQITPFKVCRNDGLSYDNFVAWFPKTFAGQVICWKEVKY